MGFTMHLRCDTIRYELEASCDTRATYDTTPFSQIMLLAAFSGAGLFLSVIAYGTYRRYLWRPFLHLHQDWYLELEFGIFRLAFAALR
ncbi:uncharacterized protein BDZ99DRAFT_443580 [Mytilinidion resinicola]|uniref:Uncharacterized protein n=1 Tax=Mytilinidion resinicola TaxID=574789 RepID=A0A6A6YN00_9PEZI|nr:uncharacterized protein BDZ99DRAFT_443580 [Mytilinidion resinicola]KAF2809345.1 hypothetical protein BDZ99DRAFT_443580 [Mytilinidion resinicola]